MSACSSRLLDLSSRDLTDDDLAAAISELDCGLRSRLEYLCLDNNRLTRLPRDVLKVFPRLRWIDLRHNRLRRFELDPPDAEAGEAPCPLHTVLLQSNLMGALPKLPRHRFPCLKTVQIDLVAAQRPDGGDDKGTGNGVGEAGDSGRGSSLLEEEYNGGGRASQRPKTPSMEEEEEEQEDSDRSNKADSIARGGGGVRPKKQRHQRIVKTSARGTSSTSANSPAGLSKPELEDLLAMERLRNMEVEKLLQRERDRRLLERFRASYAAAKADGKSEPISPPPHGTDRSAMSFPKRGDGDGEAGCLSSYHHQLLACLDREIDAVLRREGRAGDKLAASSREVGRVCGEMNKIRVRAWRRRRREPAP